MRKVIVLVGFCVVALSAQDQQDEAKYSEWMKSTQQEIGTIKGAITANDDAKVKAEADKLAGIYEQVASFWKDKGKEDAVKLADTTRDAAKAVGAANGAEAQTAALQQVQQTCRPCHTVYRNGTHFKM
jgi:cytochrome c556